MAADSTAVTAEGSTRRAARGWLARCGAAAAAVALVLLLGPRAAPAIRASGAPSRIISLVPAATEMLFAAGAGPDVIGVSSYDAYPPETKKLPRLGALLDPDVERILAMRPDLVVIYATQTDLERQLQRAGIATFDYRHAGLADVTKTIRELGTRTGHGDTADQVASGIDARLEAIHRAVANLPRPKTLLIFGRERLALRGMYASGGVGFLHDMLTAAGGDNVFADIKQQAVQTSTETIIARRPDAIVEIHSADTPVPHGTVEAEIKTWSILASVPAVRNRRVYYLIDDRLVIPGPRVAEGTKILADVLHPGAVK
jgi:iron complex transport system substrate-binding protein